MAAAGAALLLLPRVQGESQPASARASSPEPPRSPEPRQTVESAQPTESGTPEPQPSAPADPASQLRSLAARGWDVLAAIPDGRWVPQVSAKCTPLTNLDFRDASGRVGWPDGTREEFPGGITEQDILDFHTGLARRLGLDETELILVTPDALGLTERAASVCGRQTLWISLVASDVHAKREGALDYCSTSGLPQGECAARRLGPKPKFVLPSGDPPSPQDPSTYPVTAATSLTVRAAPTVDAPVLGYVKARGYVTIECTTYGDSVKGPQGVQTSLWDRISRPFAGYVSDAFVDTGGERPAFC